MTDLLAPRFIVEHPYPNSPFEVGDILMQNTTAFVFPIYATVATFAAVEGQDSIDIYLHLSKTKAYVTQGNVDDCSNIFRRLEWFEHRELGDMPEYISNVMGHIHKVAEWKFMQDCIRFVIERHRQPRHETWHNPKWYQPSTESEYLTYKNAKQ